MPIIIKAIWVDVNKVLTIINGFLFGLLGGFSPFHTKKDEPKKIPLLINLALLLVLAFILFVEIRVHYY